MTGQGHVLLHLVKLGRHDHGQGVFLTVNRALLQRGEHLGHGHGGGHNAQPFVGRHVHGVFHGAQLQTLQIIRRVDGTLVVGHVADAVLTPGQGLETFGVELGQHFLADGAVQHRACVGLVTEQERNVKNLGVGHKVGHGAGGAEGQLLGAELHGLNRFALTTQGAGVKRLNLVATAGAGFHFLGKGVDRHTLVGVLGNRNVDLHGGLCGGRGHKTDCQRQANNQFA